MRLTIALAAAASLSAVSAQGIKGFNYGAFFNNNAAKKVADFEYEFNAAKRLPGTNGQFNSARLYTMIQHGTQNTVIEAIQAAINSQTTLLLGLWCSAGQGGVDNEIAALKAAIAQYGDRFTSLVKGISVGSEDLYRNTPTSQQQNGGPGAEPQQLVRYIQQTRDAIRGTGLANVPIGHVDTWTVYVNATNNPVISALDFIGMDGYPYFQTAMANSIENANQTFYESLDATIGASQGKPVWVTETGWPAVGETRNLAVASNENARLYWEDVACSLMARGVNLYWYMLQEAQWGNPATDFGVYGPGDLGTIKPRYEVTCPGVAPVSYLYSFLVPSLLSPLFLLLLYNVSIFSYIALRLFPSKDCSCHCKPSWPIVHPPYSAKRLVEAHARANWDAKLPSGNWSNTLLPVPTEAPTRPLIPSPSNVTWERCPVSSQANASQRSL